MKEEEAVKLAFDDRCNRRHFKRDRCAVWVSSRQFELSTCHRIAYKAFQSKRQASVRYLSLAFCFHHKFCFH